MYDLEEREAAFELLRKIEKRIVAEKLRPSLSGELSDHVQKQLHFILETQFQEGSYGEIGGYIVSSGSELEFKLTENELSKYVQKFEAGNDSNEVVTFLYDSVARLKGLHIENNYGEKSFAIQMLDALCDATALFLTPDKVKKHGLEFREKFIFWYKKYVLDYFHIYEREQLNPGHIALFHVHQNSSEPSSADIELNKIKATPNIVISATTNYQHTGIKLYLVSSGLSELLYQGPLKTKP